MSAIEQLTNMTMMLKLEEQAYEQNPSKASGARIRALTLKIKKLSDNLRKSAISRTRVVKKVKPVEAEPMTESESEAEAEAEVEIPKPVKRSKSRRKK